MKDCIVIGAGAAGLSAAHALVASGMSVLVLECETEAGGRARTKLKHGVVLEHGAGFVANFYSSTLELAREAGVVFQSPKLVPGRSGRIHKLLTPQGIVPHDLGSPIGLLRSPLLSLRDKVRAIASLTRLLLEGAPHIADLSALARHDAGLDAAQWGRTAFGPDAIDYIARLAVEPFFYFGLEQISAEVARSLLHHAICWRPLVAPGGMQDFIDPIAGALDIRYSARVTSIAIDGNELLVNHSAGTNKARAVIVAVPVPSILGIGMPLGADDRADLESIDYVPSVRANFGYNKAPILTAPIITIAGPGPHRISGVSEVSGWNPTRVPFGTEVVRVSATAWRSQELFGQNKAAILAELRTDCEEIGINLPQPAWTDVVSIRNALVLPSPGHFRKTLRFQQRRRRHLYFAGDWLTGSTIEGAVRSGMDAAKAVLADFLVSPLAVTAPRAGWIIRK